MSADRAPDVAALVKGVLDGSRAALARAVTLLESRRPAHRAAAQELLTELLPRAGGARRVGISGAPGVGKSTFVEALGTRLTGVGRRVAVLAVDPTSVRTGGSILGDKTRMPRLAVDDNAFVRPSPSAGTLGGVTRATRAVGTSRCPGPAPDRLMETCGGSGRGPNRHTGPRGGAG